MGNRNLLVCCLLCLLLLVSCNYQNKSSMSSTIGDTIYVEKSDSMVYKLPEKTTNVIINMIIDKEVSHCNISKSVDNENEYNFSFSYVDKTFYTQRDTVLLSRTNTYLKLKDRYLPVITEFDDVFSNIPQESFPINDFNFCFVTVNSRGELIDSFAY